MEMPPFILIAPATRGLSLALARHYLRTTSLPVFATYRPSPPATDRPRTADSVRAHILHPLPSVDPARLHLLPLDLASEDSVAAAADALARALAQLSGSSAEPSFLRVAVFLAGVLHPERQPADLVLDDVLATFRLNVVSHLLAIKHFSRFLPPAARALQTSTSTSAPAGAAEQQRPLVAKWAHVSARVGSISDNRLGGWYSYRASKAALNQVVRTFDLHLQARRLPAVAVGLHPGTVKTDLSRDFWKGVSPEKLFAPEYAAARLAEVVEGLREDQRGRIWDWKGEEVKP
ncbi:NAD(P)-binding protein [Dichomitus squalens LYAD-421 SS1]|uniref:NAD(P)-binding protein n=1 Tax=Dichomitus squalens (strain LYAD-421) TaxID=732165 RepID=UPI00044154B6|nr:NAD(P)-binding protein [Dichomitus squalens LYAD-421 SS1]EJF63220.1 NAD(P)-binding protein [Dichomitus squalens LYAD-421 SS1]